MPVLAAHCRKNVTPEMPCAKEADRLASVACEGLTGDPRGRCKTANYENYLAQLCADIVCPNDPNRLAAAGISTTAKTTTVNADQGGGFDKLMDQFSLQSGGSSEPTTTPSGGTDPRKMRTYLLGGIAVAAVVIVAVSFRKK